MTDVVNPAVIPRHVLVFTSENWRILSDAMNRDWNVETVAFVLAEAVLTPSKAWRLLATEILVPPDEVYLERTINRATVNQAFVADVLRRARQEERAVFWVHSHPDGSLIPSERDLNGESQLLPRLRHHSSKVPHGRLIRTLTGLHAHLFLPLGQEASIDVQSVSERLELLTVLSAEALREVHARQALAFGDAGQRAIQHTRFAVIGAGGTGSLVIQQLAHLGAKYLRVYDMDILEETNLNRVVGATLGGVGALKVEVAAAMARSINPDIEVWAVPGDITDASVARTLLDVDFFFCCTDSHGSRAVLSQLAYQYLLPGVDLGVVVRALPSGQTRVAGRVQMLAPGLPCLLCADVLDLERVRVDLMSPAARQADPYVVGERVVQPAVISLNASVASAAVTMMLGAVAGITASARHQVMRLDVGLTSTPIFEAQPTCPHCSESGALGHGDRWTVVGRSG